MRVSGRLSRAAMPDVSKQQAILPKDSHIPRLVLSYIHQHMQEGITCWLNCGGDSGYLEPMEPLEEYCLSASLVRSCMAQLASKLWQIYQNAGFCLTILHLQELALNTSAHSW